MFRRFALLLMIPVFLLLLRVPDVSSEAVWNDETPSPYSTAKNYSPGDLITVLIIESSSALHRAGTDTGVKDDLGLRFNHTITDLYSSVGPRNEIDIRGENKYRGTGSTTRTSNIQAKIAAMVTKVFPNGNLAIVGRHVIEVNKEKQEITISGLIRSKDVTSSNTVYSFQVAEAKITVKGEGAVAEAESPGWFTRIINWLF